MAAAKAFARYFREETALERAAVRITRSARTYRFCQRGDALYGGAAEKARAWRRALCRKSAKKILSARQKRRRNAAFWPPACDKAWPDRGARRRIKSGVKFWRIKSIVSQYVPAQAACYRALAAEKIGMQKKARNIARRPNAFWTREIKRLGGGFFQNDAGLLYPLCRALPSRAGRAV